MKKFLATVGVLVFGSAAWAAIASDVLFVGKFDGKGVAQDEASTIEGSVCSAATQDKRFVVKCRDTNAAVLQLREAQAQMGFGEGAAADNCGPAGCIGSLAGGLDAKWVLGGSLAKLAEKQYLLTLVVVDPVSNQTLNRIEEKVAGDVSAVVDRVPGAVRRALAPPQQAPPPATPAPVKK
jgi:hypothetical protein